MNEPVKSLNPVPPTGITGAERARRQAAVDYGRHTVRLEGFVLSEFAEDLNRRYVNGEITSDEHLQALKAHHGI